MISNEAITGLAVTEAWQALSDHEDGWLKRAQGARNRWDDLAGRKDYRVSILNRASFLLDAAISFRIGCTAPVSDACKSLMWTEDDQC